MERQKLIRISSRDRNNYQSTTSSKFNVSMGQDGHISNAIALQIKEVQFLNTAYNVSKYNNTFYYHSGAVEYSITVPIGQYILADFITAFDAALLAHLPSITMSTTLSNVTKKLNFNCTPAITFYEIRPNGIKNPMADILGLETSSAIATGNHTAGGVHDLSGLNSLYILSPQLSSDSIISSNNAIRLNVLDIVPVTSGFSDLISHEPDNSDIFQFSDGLNKNLSTVDIELRDTDNHPVDLNGGHIDIICKLFY